MDKKLLEDIKEYLKTMLDDELHEGFVLMIYEDVCLTSGYEEEGLYSYDDIVICTRRNIVEMINENY